ncbi:hypothetical protein GH714_023747 [Hevea brasiliensis]|uniref:Tyrosine-protein phosphatase domain-containing protein n=1 Tax=Hevea brasiliensis TaxID=3981 RepID=A0A6A6LBR4_HEVBR|nr:hypothetical protein GH714_023747 [Hevea brasiliensis]
MAASSAGTPPPDDISSSRPTPFVFSSDCPTRISLTPDQRKYCSEALQLFREKLRTPEQIIQEFAHLQAIRITPSQMARNCKWLLTVSTRAKTVIRMWYLTSSSESISRFIATQGPVPHTFEDFWEMVIQYRCPVIVMLTRLVDNYKSEEPPMSVLHVQYTEWPDHGVPKDTLTVREILKRIPSAIESGPSSCPLQVHLMSPVISDGK